MQISLYAKQCASAESAYMAGIIREAERLERAARIERNRRRANRGRN